VAHDQANELLMSEQPGEGMKQKREELVERARVYFELALRRDPKHPQHLRNFGLFLKQHFSNEYTVCISGTPSPPLRSFCLISLRSSFFCLD
jgi:hypothetical protein